MESDELPSIYTRVDYIKATSDAYIETSYVPTRYDAFDAEFTFDGSNGTYGCLFSAGTGTYQMLFLMRQGATTSYLRYFSNNSTALSLAFSTNTWYTMSLSSSGTLKINGKTNTLSYLAELDGNDKTMILFKRKNNTSNLYGKLKYFRITNNGTVKMNLIPCIRNNDGKAGVYDTVSKTFMSSSGNEEFTPSTSD